MYFFIHSYRHKDIFPWGFGIVFAGLLVTGIGYQFSDNQVVIFSMNLTLAVSLIGILWNINNIQDQFRIGNISKFLLFTGTGLACGLLLGFFFVIVQGTKYIQVDPRYTITAYITSSIQTSMAEELLFRGYLLSYLRKYEFNLVFSVVFQALLFAILHIPRYPGNWTAIFIVFLGGLTAGYLTWKNINLIPALVLHIVINLMAVTWWYSQHL